MFKKKGLLLMMLIIGIAIGATGAFTYADSTNSTPGSVDDPLITKSYFDEQIKGLVENEFNKQKVTLDGQIAETVGNQVKTQLANIQAQLGDSLNQWVIVTVKPGNLLTGSSGAQFVVRSGRAVIYSTDNDGLSNLTIGKDLANKQAVVNNHLLLVPRAGRGIQTAPEAKADLVVLVKGTFQNKPLAD